MAITSKQIAAFALAAGVSGDACRIDFTYTDGTKTPVGELSPARFAAIVSVLQATKIAYCVYDDVAKTMWVSSSLDVPGP